MNIWIAGIMALLAGMVALLWVLVRADTMSRVVALEVAQVNTTLIFLLLAKQSGRSFIADEAIVLSLLSLVGGLAFLRVLQRWL